MTPGKGAAPRDAPVDRGAVRREDGQPTHRDSQSTRHARVGWDEYQALRGVGATARDVYVALCLYRGNGEAWPTRATLAEVTGLSDQSVKTALGQLVSAGLIVRRQVGARRWVTEWPTPDGGPETVPPQGVDADLPDTSGGTNIDPPGGTEIVPAKEQTIRTLRQAPTGLTARGVTAAPAPADSKVPVMPQPALPQPGQHDIFGGEVDTPPVDWPNELRRAYHAAWRQAHHCTPPSTHVERMYGKVREVERAIRRNGADHEWPMWVEAAARAARCQSWDIVAHATPRRPAAYEQPSRIGRTMALAAEMEADGL